MALMPDYLRLTPNQEAELKEIRRKAKERHEKARRKAKKQGRSFPDMPFECSRAYEEEFRRKTTNMQDLELSKKLEERKKRVVIGETFEEFQEKILFPHRFQNS